ncbi:MAG: hypothetical protein CR967_05940 [Proteobacteria bacterium]|nr:MAG: hypothetical protein CR967_05940 [Pseudomonadota bacterium]
MYLTGSAINVEEGYILLVIIMVINPAIVGYYHLKSIVHMLIKEPLENSELSSTQNSTLTIKSLVGFCVILTIFAIF